MKRVVFLAAAFAAALSPLPLHAASIPDEAIEVCGPKYWKKLKLPSEAQVLMPTRADMLGDDVLLRFAGVMGVFRAGAPDRSAAADISVSTDRERAFVVIAKGKMTVHTLLLVGSAGKYDGPSECIRSAGPTPFRAIPTTQETTSICPAGTRHVGITVKGSDPGAPTVVMPYDGGDYSTSKTVRWDISGSKAKRTQFVAECNPNEVGLSGVTLRDIPMGVDGCAFAEGRLNCQ